MQLELFQWINEAWKVIREQQSWKLNFQNEGNAQIWTGLTLNISRVISIQDSPKADYDSPHEGFLQVFLPALLGQVCNKRLNTNNDYYEKMLLKMCSSSHCSYLGARVMISCATLVDLHRLFHCCNPPHVPHFNKNPAHVSDSNHPRSFWFDWKIVCLWSLLSLWRTCFSSHGYLPLLHLETLESDNWRLSRVTLVTLLWQGWLVQPPHSLMTF